MDVEALGAVGAGVERIDFRDWTEGTGAEGIDARCWTCVEGIYTYGPWSSVEGMYIYGIEVWG